MRSGWSAGLNTAWPAPIPWGTFEVIYGERLLRLAAYEKYQSANEQAQKLSKIGYSAYCEFHKPDEGSSFFRVRIGKFGSSEEADRILYEIRKLEYDGFISQNWSEMLAGAFQAEKIERADWVIYWWVHSFLDIDSPPASDFALRATTGQVARGAKSAEDIFLISFRWEAEKK